MSKHTDSLMKIVFMSPWSSSYIKEWTEKDLLPKIQIETLPREATIEEVKNLVKNADMIFGDISFHFPINREIIEAAKKCKLIHQPTVGYEHIDTQAAKEHGIPVANNEGMNSNAVAEHAIMMMLSLLKKTKWMDEETQKCNWMFLEACLNNMIWELDGRSVGIIGLGRTGRELVKKLKVFTPNILYYKRNKLPIAEEADLGISYRPFHDLLRECDIVSLHVPLTPETRNMIGHDEISMMKQGAILLNLARGGVVDYNALADALKKGHLSGAGVDVYDPEPIQPDCPLIGLRNVILTPHIAGATLETRVKSRIMLNENMRRVQEGRTPINLVN